MHKFFEILFSLHYYEISSIIGMIAIIYPGTIGSLLFNFYIIPKIENRYHKKIIFYDFLNQEPYRRAWMKTQFEISFYIFIRYIGFKKKHNKYLALDVINYDMKTANKAEIIASFVTIGAIIISVICQIIAVATKDIHH